MRPTKKTFLISVLCAALILSACASDVGVFPTVVTSVSESEAVLPNPVSIITDPTNSQIVVANSNVDIFFDSGSLAVLSVNATDTNAPTLTATQITSTPNFAGQIYFDATNTNIYVPFREASAADSSLDQIIRYSLGAGSLTENASSTVAANPFGVTGDATRIFTVSDDTLTVSDLALSNPTTVDLTTADTAGLSNANSSQVEYVALDATRNRAFVSNALGDIMMVDLTTNNLDALIDGPSATRNLIVDGDTLYALDPVGNQVWIFDLSAISDPTTPPTTLDDSTLALATIPVGNSASGMALDNVTNRLYVANSTDNTVSVLDTVADTEIARLSVASDDLTSFNRGGDSPYALALGTFNATQYLFVANFSSNSVIMINTVTLKVVQVYPNNAL